MTHKFVDGSPKYEEFVHFCSQPIVKGSAKVVAVQSVPITQSFLMLSA